MLLGIYLLLLSPVLVSAGLEEYDEPFILQFINRSQTLDLSSKCKQSLALVYDYLNDIETLTDQKICYFESFATGPNDLFLSRDQDRWVYKGYECLLSAGETVYSKSEHPMHYCYTHDDDKDKRVPAFSVCIPSPCADENQKLLEEWRRITHPEATEPITFTACTRSRHEKQWFELPIPIADFGFNMGLAMLVVMATIFHNMRGEDAKTWSARILLAFSAKTNFKKLIALPKDPQSCITCLLGLRFGSMVWTLIGHSFIFVQAYMENVEEFKVSMVDNFFNQWITNFTLSVDVFLTLGGTVLSYSWFRKWLKNTSEEEPTWTSWGYWLRFYRHRVVRLYPAYLYTLLAVTLRISVTHFHPMWPPTDPAIQCPKYWWQNVLFVNSIMDNQCMPWTWYIGTEFIYYLLSPIFLLSLRKAPKVGFILCFVVIMLSAGLNVESIVRNNFPPTQFLWKQPEIFNPNFIQHHLELYIKPQYRIGPYLIGILLGYQLARYQRIPVKPQQSSRYIITMWSIALFGIFFGLYGLYPALQGWDSIAWRAYHLLYGALHRDVFSIGVAFLIYICHTGIGGPVNVFLSSNFFLPLANLSFSAYLFHMIPVVLTYMLVPFPIYFNTQIPLFIHCFVQLVITYFFAIICTMVSELPALNIERLLLATPQKTTLKPIPPTDSELQLKTSEKA
ncbi:hypothetical protein GCK72_005616 [Caenorhabditis remanei]|uniref:Acyltransferase 3 domain-containing protein n=1 Tax=Caenorhabditis remanei TaxID=31234 RepID=A0A6A5HH16_CAERE|nr:hypothetical protein GCK72_005616 [Caenorhabditis remanei]KAF1765663.1 hypothetical protein GCK72_005616 [Caenorhabditis remanei]